MRAQPQNNYCMLWIFFAGSPVATVAVLAFYCRVNSIEKLKEEVVRAQTPENALDKKDPESSYNFSAESESEDWVLA